MNESWKHYGVKETRIRDHEFHDSISVKCLEQADVMDSMLVVSLAGGTRTVTASGCRVTFWSDKNVLGLNRKDGSTARRRQEKTQNYTL
jgi:hypothetical protein